MAKEDYTGDDAGIDLASFKDICHNNPTIIFGTFAMQTELVEKIGGRRFWGELKRQRELLKDADRHKFRSRGMRGLNDLEEELSNTQTAKQREREEETQLPCAVNDVLPKKPTRPEGQKTDFRAHTFPKRATSYITKSSSVVELARSWEEGKNADVQTAVTP